MMERSLYDVVRPKHVVGDRFNDIDLHQRDVFMCCGMEDNLRLMLIKYLRESLGVAHIRNHGRHCEIGIILFEFEQDFKDAVLTMTKQHQFSWIAPHDLTTEFTTD